METGKLAIPRPQHPVPSTYVTTGQCYDISGGPLIEHRAASKSPKGKIPKRLRRPLCGKPLAFRRRQPRLFPSARLEGSAFQPSRGG